MKTLVTGGAGFIGSHLVEKISSSGDSVNDIADVTVFDNFSTGKREFLKSARCKIIEGDVKDFNLLLDASKGMEEVFHICGDINVRRSIDEPRVNFDTEVIGTFNLLEACRKNDVKSFAYSSSFWVYGNPAVTPTPEDTPIHPINNYGAAKAACESFITSYSELYGINSVIFRYTAVMGPRLLARVVHDLYVKLKKNPRELEIFGDGTQQRGFVHVKDCVDGSLFAKKVAKKPIDVFNVGIHDTITVKEIADLLVERMGLENVNYKFTGGSIGWKGDVSVMVVSSEKLMKLGWKPKFTVRQSIIDSIDWLKENV